MLRTLEFIVDIIWLVHIALNFVKRTRMNKTFYTIWMSYITSSFVFDIVGTLPCFLLGENMKFYWLKLFRTIVHMFWLTLPLEMIMRHFLRKLSKKRQNDLISFGSLILMVTYIAHISGCYFIQLGLQFPCKIDPD